MLALVKEFFLALCSIVFPLIFVLVLAVLGWYLVWKLFLSRFRFVRELLGAMGETPTHSATHSKGKPRREE